MNWEPFDWKIPHCVEILGFQIISFSAAKNSLWLTNAVILILLKVLVWKFLPGLIHSDVKNVKSKGTGMLKTGRGGENSQSNKCAGVFIQFKIQLLLLLPMELLWHRELVLQRRRSWNNQDLWEGWKLPAFPISRQGVPVLGRARHFQRRCLAPEWHQTPFRSSFSLLPNEAEMTPFEQRCLHESVQHPQQGTSGHSWSSVMKDTEVIQSRKEKSTSSSGERSHTPVPQQHLPRELNLLLKSGQRAVKEEKENCLHWKCIVWLISQWLKQFRAISRIRARDLLCDQANQPWQEMSLPAEVQTLGLPLWMAPCSAESPDTSHAGTSLSLQHPRQSAATMLLLQSIRLD